MWRDWDEAPPDLTVGAVRASVLLLAGRRACFGLRQCGIRARSRCIQFAAPPRLGSVSRAASRAATESVASALGSVLASLGRLTIGIGLDAINSAVYNTFHVDQHR